MLFSFPSKDLEIDLAGKTDVSVTYNGEWTPEPLTDKSS